MLILCFFFLKCILGPTLHKEGFSTAFSNLGYGKIFCAMLHIHMATCNGNNAPYFPSLPFILPRGSLWSCMKPRKRKPAWLGFTFVITNLQIIVIQTLTPSHLAPEWAVFGYVASNLVLSRNGYVPMVRQPVTNKSGPVCPLCGLFSKLPRYWSSPRPTLDIQVQLRKGRHVGRHREPFPSLLPV